MIAATAAVAKVAAAAEAPSSYSFLPSVSVTPIAQPNRLKKVLRSIDSNHVRENVLFKEHAGITKNASNGQRFVMQNQHPNGICVDVSGGLSNVKILNQSKDPSVTSVESMASGHGRSNSNVVRKQQGWYVKSC